jgi:hypothetical protein
MIDAHEDGLRQRAASCPSRSTCLCGIEGSRLVLAHAFKGLLRLHAERGRLRLRCGAAWVENSAPRSTQEPPPPRASRSSSCDSRITSPGEHKIYSASHRTGRVGLPYLLQADHLAWRCAEILSRRWLARGLRGHSLRNKSLPDYMEATSAITAASSSAGVKEAPGAADV